MKSTFSIYDQADSQRLMTLVCRDLDLDPKRYPPRSFSNQVSNLKNELVDHETFAGRAETHLEKTLAEAYRLYQRRLHEANAFDFDDLIMTTVHLLQAFPDVAEHYRRRFRHVLVDEYQDTNHAQYVLVQELVTGGDPSLGVPPAELCVVGDADQSIYAFRGATIRNILAFEQDYPDATHDPARAELPLHPDHPVRGQRGHLPQRQPQAQEPLVGRRARARRSSATSPTTSTTRPRSSPRRSTGSPTTRACCRPRWRCSTGPTRSPGCSRRSSSGSACPTRWSAACASTSGARCATRWPTCGCWPTRPTPCRCAASSTCPSAASATGPRRASRPSRSASRSPSTPRCSGARTPTGWPPGRCRRCRGSGP